MSNFICLPQFDIAGLLYFVHFCLSKNSDNYKYTFLRNYLGDFLALIVVIPFIVNIEILLKCRIKKFITFKEILSFALLYSLVYEVIAPFLFQKGTASFLDCIAYFLGGFCLYFSQYLTGELESRKKSK